VLGVLVIRLASVGHVAVDGGVVAVWAMGSNSIGMLVDWREKAQDIYITPGVEVLPFFDLQLGWIT